MYSYLEYSFPLAFSVALGPYLKRCNNTWWNITAIYLQVIACLGINARLSCYKAQHRGTSRPRPPSLPKLTVHSRFIRYSWYSVVFCFLFIVYFTSPLGSRYIAWKAEWLMNGELERIWKERVVVSSGHYLSVCLEGLRRTTKVLSRDSRSPECEWKKASPEYKSTALPIPQPAG
jgi:hypothetical protein